MALHFVIFNFDFVYIRLLCFLALPACMEKVCLSLKDKKFDITKLISIMYTSLSLGVLDNINKLVENVNKNNCIIFAKTVLLHDKTKKPFKLKIIYWQAERMCVSLWLEQKILRRKKNEFKSYRRNKYRIKHKVC